MRGVVWARPELRCNVHAVSTHRRVYALFVFSAGLADLSRHEHALHCCKPSPKLSAPSSHDSEALVPNVHLAAAATTQDAQRHLLCYARLRGFEQHTQRATRHASSLDAALAHGRADTPLAGAVPVLSDLHHCNELLPLPC